MAEDTNNSDTGLRPQLANDEPAAAEAPKAERESSNAATEDAPEPREPDTVASAKVFAPHVDPDMRASHHLAQKFGNDPANPAPLPHVTADYNGPTVRLTRKSPDVPQGELAVADVHPDMKGDYLRAGWSGA